MFNVLTCFLSDYDQNYFLLKLAQRAMGGLPPTSL